MPLAARHYGRPGPVWVGAFLWIIQCLLVLGAMAALAMTFVVSKDYGLLFVFIAIALGILIAIRWIQSRAVSCPLCHGKILHGSKCHKHRDARRRGLFTYTSSLLMDVLLSGRFTCMYCGTPFRMRR
jgi:hypothetical protein